jgi:magnesium chelatase subunit D
LNSYQKRDKVALIAFRGNDASVLLPPSSSIGKAVRYLKDLPTGGKTPLAAGISKGLDLITDEKRRKPDIVPMMVLISDGRSNVPFKGDNIKEELIELSGRLNQDGVHLVIIDTETNVNKFSGKLGYNEMIAETSNGIYYKLDDLTPQSVENVVKMELNKII